MSSGTNRYPNKNREHALGPAAGFAVAIEALSWMSYSGIGERASLFKAASQLGVKRVNDLRESFKFIMETTRYQNRLERILAQVLPEEEQESTPHGISSFLRILAYLRYVDGARPGAIQRYASLGRQILGWRELHPYENQVAQIASGRATPKFDGLPELERIALETCHPSWFVARIVTVFGRNTALRILRRNLQPLPSYGRMNSLKVVDQNRTAAIAKQLGEEIDGLPGLVRITGRERPSKYVESGEFVLQDLASMVTTLVANPKPGQTVFDLCSAPGNKTTHLAAFMGKEGRIYSIDSSIRRLNYWRKEISRCGVDIAIPIRADARKIPFNMHSDLVLIDPPCSNTGVFARNPAGKWRLSASRITDLTLKQKEILQAGSQLVGRQGNLVYCTCSILPEENEYVIESFLRRNPEFELIPQSPFLGSKGLMGLELCQRFYSHIHDCNGYFIAKMRKTA